MKSLMDSMGRSGWIHTLNLTVFSLAVALAFNLYLPVDWITPRVIDISQPDTHLPSTRTLAATEIVGFAALTQESAIETTPPRWLEDKDGLGENFRPLRRYLLPLRSNRCDHADGDMDKCLIAVRISTDGELGDALKNIPASLRGRLRLPQASGMLLNQRHELEAAATLAESTGHSRVMILDRVHERRMPLVLGLIVFFLLTVAAAAVLYTDTLSKCIYVPIGMILVMVGVQFWWLYPDLSPTLSSIESMVTPAIAAVGAAMLLAASWLEIAKKFRNDTLQEFRFDLEQQLDDDHLFVGEDHLRLTNGAGVATIRDADVHAVTWWHIVSYVDKNIAKGYFMTIISHSSEDGTSIQTTAKTDFEDPKGSYGPENDRLAVYRLRIADARAAVMTEQLDRTGKVEGDGWSIDREQVCVQPAFGKKISFPRSTLQDCCFIEEEFAIYHAESKLPLRITSNTPDQLILGRVLKTLVTEQSIAMLESRPEGRVLARFTSQRVLMKNRNMPKWGMHVIAYAFLVVPMVLAQLIEKHLPNPVAGILPVFWFLAAFLAFAWSFHLLRKWRPRHLDLCEKGIRLVRGRVSRMIPWESISNAELDHRHVTGNGQHATTAYTFNFIINEEAKPLETVSFTWDSGFASCGEITALEKFVAVVQSSSSEQC
jgi:hypothetical protein